MLVTIDAVYANGVLKPLTPLNLAENQLVTLQMVAPATMPTKPDPTVVTFREIWPRELADALEQALADIRKETNAKLERLAEELDEALSA